MRIGAGNIRQTWNRGRGQQRNSGYDSSSGNSSSTNSDNSTSGGNSSSTSDGVSNQTGFSTTTADRVSSSVTYPDGAVTLTYPNVPFRTTTGPPEDDKGNVLPISNAYSTNVTNTGSNTGNASTTSLARSASDAVSDLLGLTNTGSQNRLASAVFSAADFDIIISALKSQNDTRLISNPTVVTLNNTEATINIGKEFPIPNFTYNQERGTYEISNIDYKTIGINLRVTPQVNSRGFIKLDIEPEVSSTNESVSLQGTTIPIVSTRKTKTQVSLRDGYTMGIGGLIEQSESGGETRVPVLGSIPLLGRLFRSESKNNSKRNLIIFITAKTVSPEGASIEEVFDSRRVRELNMSRKDLPGYRDGSDPFLPNEP